MKKHHIGLILTTIVSSLSIALISNLHVNYETVEVNALGGYTNGDGDTYYSSIDENSSTLLSDLQSLNSSKRKATPGYSGLWDYFKYTDYYTSFGASDGLYTAFYQAKSGTKSEMNKEHVWPKSHGGNLVEGDIHMTRPTFTSDNSSRGNSFYVEGMSHSSNGWDPYTAGMEESYRGDCARIIFYCCVASSTLSLSDLSYSSTSNSNRDNLMGKLSDLLKWNLQYPVQQREMNRNEGAEYVQGNRNPFIDHPEYACKIWGNTNDETRSICSSYVSNKTLTKITITADETYGQLVSENHYINLKATGVYSDETTSDLTNQVTWKSLDTSIAKVNNNKVTGVSGTEGGQHVNITATYGTITGTLGIYVYSTPGYGTEITTTSSSSFTLVNNSDDLVVGNEYIIACNSKNVTAGALTDSYLKSVSSTFSSDLSTIETVGEGTLIFTLSGSTDNYVLTCDDGKLSSTAEKKVNTSGTGTSTWKISVSTGSTTITSTNSNYGKIQYNSSSPRFTTYASSQTGIQLYTRSSSGSGNVETDSISLDKSSLSLNINEAATITATASKNVTWSVNNNSLVNISTSGDNNEICTITALNEGNLVLTATAGNASSTCDIVINTPVEQTSWPFLDDVAYKLYYEKSSTNYYFTGNTANYVYYGETSTAKSSGADIYFEPNSNNGHNMFYTLNSTKTYIQVIVSGTYINFNLTTTEPSSGWNYDIDNNCLLFDIDGTNYTLGTYNNYTTLSAGTLSKITYKATLMLSNEFDADTYATTFLNNITCSGDGNITFDQNSWTNMKNEFYQLSSSDRLLFKNGTGNVSGTNIEQCIARYDAIVTKYGTDVYEDFMSRGIVSNSKSVLSMINNNTNIETIICVISIISILSIGFVVLFTKSSKEE